MSIREVYWKLIPYDWRPGQLWYRLKCFCWHRYTTVKPRYLDHTWCDCCELLPHTMFEILSQFIEKECSPGCVDWFSNDTHKKVRNEMQELYDWWHKVYQKQYPATEERLWKHAEKHKPIVDWVDIENDCQEYRPIWKTGRDEKLYRLYLDATISLEARMDQQLKDQLHRIINIMPYMWT